MKLVVDNRELSTIPYFVKDTFEYDFELKTIEAGDYHLYDSSDAGKLIAIIERKTWSDLSDTISGTRSNNIEKILVTKKKFDCMVFYLMEGAIPTNKKQHCAGGKSYTYENLLTHLDHLMMNYGIFTIFSLSYKDSVERLNLLVKNFISNKRKEKIDIENIKNWEVTEGGEDELPKFEKNFNLMLRDMVTSIPHISLNLYELFKPKLKDLLSNNITVDEIAKMKYNSGKSLGIKKANQIKKSLNKLHFKNDTTLPIKVLSQIKNISKATATLLLEHYKFDFFLNLTDETTEELLNFTINGKKQTKKLENIVEIFKLLS